MAQSPVPELSSVKLDLGAIATVFHDNTRTKKWPKDRLSVSFMSRLAGGMPLGQILYDKEQPYKPSPEANIGSVVHARFMDRLDEDIVVIPNTRPLGGKGITKEIKAENEAFNAGLDAMREAANKAYKTPVSEDEHAKGCAVGQKLAEYFEAKYPFDRFAVAWKTHQMLFEVRFVTKIWGANVSGSIDCLWAFETTSGWGLAIDDVKTGGRMDSDTFSKDLGSRGYIFQVALYKQAVEQLTGIPVVSVGFPVAQTSEPFICGRYTLHPDSIDQAKIPLQRACMTWSNYIEKPDDAELNFSQETIEVPRWFWRKTN